MENSRRMLLIASGAVVVAAGGFGLYHWQQTRAQTAALNRVAQAYTTAFAKGRYAKLASTVDTTHLTGAGWHYNAKTLAARNWAVFSRVGASRIKISKLKVSAPTKGVADMTFTANMSTRIGKLKAQHYRTTLVRVDGTWKVRWAPDMLFPGMDGKDSVQLKLTPAVRGQIYDRNHQPLAENGTATQAGLIPGKLGEGTARTANLAKIAAAWEVKVASLETLLKQSWVTDDTFVPVKVVSAAPTLTGAQYQTIGARTYPLGAAAAQLVGYVNNATADDIAKDPTLSADSQIGKAGLEQTYDKRLRGTAGGSIYILNGNNTRPILETKAKAGKDVTLTIDADKQKAAFAALNNKPGSVVTMDTASGDLLTLASSPSYDPNKFATGISQSDYDAYAKNTDLPFVSRFTERFAPGSTFKMLTAAIAFQNNTINAATTKTIHGLKWQADSSWGSYKVTRTVDASPENATQALVNSDNIWFAQVALQMGEKAYLKGLKPLFAAKAALPLTQRAPQISNSGQLASQTLLADTAYGQGQLLLSPIQQAAIYSAIPNAGAMRNPVLLAGKTGKRTSVLGDAASNAVYQDLTHVVSDASGTAHGLSELGHNIAAKTGTAELKQKQDTDGKQNGFLVTLGSDNTTMLTVSMLENAGSGDVVTAVKPYLQSLYQ